MDSYPLYCTCTSANPPTRFRNIDRFGKIDHQSLGRDGKKKKPWVFFYNCTSFVNNRTSSPGWKAGRPIYGHPSHLNASPKEQFPQLPTFPLTVKSTSASSSDRNLARFWSASDRLAASSASSRWARPHVQSLHARRRLPAAGRHEAAEKCRLG